MTRFKQSYHTITTSFEVANKKKQTHPTINFLKQAATTRTQKPMSKAVHYFKHKSTCKSFTDLMVNYSEVKQNKISKVKPKKLNITMKIIMGP